MTRILYAAVALAVFALPAAAQNAPQTNQNSGTGISGPPGGKSGPAVKSGRSDSNTQTGSDSQTNATARNQDVSKIPGKAGGKSGPAARPPHPQ